MNLRSFRYTPLLALTLGMLLLAFVTPAGAEDGPDEEARARALFKQAEVHFSLGEFERALALYREAYRAKQLPELLFNIGQCYRYRKNCDRAVFHFKQYLLKSPESPQRVQVEQLIQECESQMAKEAAPDPAPSPPDEPEPKTLEPLVPRAWFWAGVGITSALLVAGTVTGILARVKNNEYLAAETPIERRTDLKASGQTLETHSWITLGVAAGTAAASAALFLLSRPREERPGTAAARPRISAAISGTGAGLVLQGSF